ncbi:hypothetical protein ATCV1_z795R [Acanthocystis turfacea chlorella virus 1]|uniref:Uncharacterized protein z795R n=1 Tax=Chlorovirus heliozoae TaxID=322019 RepID=A7KA55_9PHYC|nr:hypothetical protein ATCV1_z795R [Acanthocystis turfacea chlorella virus 1]ABT16929.1 hypothetical protein ATCV1_z795R [Acanthocystis turfacea chlorella virus 1]
MVFCFARSASRAMGVVGFGLFTLFGGARSFNGAGFWDMGFGLVDGPRSFRGDARGAKGDAGGAKGDFEMLPFCCSSFLISPTSFCFESLALTRFCCLFCATRVSFWTDLVSRLCAAMSRSLVNR